MTGNSPRWGLGPGDLYGVAHALAMSVPLDALQHVGRPSDLSSDPPRVTPVSAVTAPSLAAVAAPVSPSPALLEGLTSEIVVVQGWRVSSHKDRAMVTWIAGVPGVDVRGGIKLAW